MKILYFMDGLYRGGKERRLLQLLRYVLERKLAEVEVALMSREVAYPEFHDLKIKTHYLIRKGKKDLRVLRDLYHLCREFQPDIIHVWDSMTAVYATPVAKVVGAKLMNGMITDAPKNLSRWSREFLRAKLTFPFSDAIVANSAAGLQAYQAPPSRSVCIYSGFDRRRNARLEDPKIVRDKLGIRTKNVVGMVGEFAERKDYRTYVLAAQQVLQAFDDVTFLGIGDGPTLGSVKGFVAEANNARILFPGWQTAVESIINIFDIAVLSTYSEGISNSILEYMSLGKPVIASNPGGTPEVVVDKVTGVLVPGQSIDALAGAILRLLRNPEEGRSMGLRGVERIDAVFSLEEMGSRYCSLYSSLSIKS